MNRNVVIAVALAGVMTGQSQAQNAGVAAQDAPAYFGPDAAALKQGQQLLDGIASSALTRRTHIAGTLEHIQSLGLPATPANVHTVRRLLATAGSSDDRAAAARLLGRLYTPADTFSLNAAIVSDLKVTFAGNDEQAARTAVLTLSRLAYQPDHIELLRGAKDRRLISTDEYYAELAHVLPYSPGHAQNDLAALLRRGHNAFAIGIVASMVRNDSVRAKLTVSASRHVLAALEENPPPLPAALGEFGYVDAALGNDWLLALATMRSEVRKDDFEATVLAHLNAQSTDPRTVIGFLASPEGRHFMAGVGRRRAFQTAYAKAVSYANQFPQSTVMQELKEEAGKSMRQLSD